MITTIPESKRRTIDLCLNDISIVAHNNRDQLSESDRKRISIAVETIQEMLKPISSAVDNSKTR